MFKCLCGKGTNSFKKLKLWELGIVTIDEDNNVLFLDLVVVVGVSILW